MQRTLRKFFPLFVLPTLIAFVIVFLIPFLMGIYLSFTEFTTCLLYTSGIHWTEKDLREEGA